MTDLEQAIEKATAKGRDAYVELLSDGMSDYVAVNGTIKEFLAAMQREGFRFERDWMPIENAPKDGTAVLGFSPPRGRRDSEVIVMRAVIERGKNTAWLTDIEDVQNDVTHFKPIPEGPSK